MHHEGAKGTKEIGPPASGRHAGETPAVQSSPCLRGELKASGDGKEFADLVGVLVAGAALDAGGDIDGSCAGDPHRLG